MSSGWPHSTQKVHLVVAVEVILVGSITKLHTFQKLTGDVGIAGCRHERGEPVET